MQLKIRGWDKEKKRYYRDICDGHILKEIVAGGEIKLYFLDTDENGLVIGINALLPLLFTTKKDKIGQEIYEGDILRVFINGEYGICEVVFHDGSFCLLIDGEYYPCLCDEYRDNIEVIGNRFENKELLKVKG